MRADRIDEGDIFDERRFFQHILIRFAFTEPTVKDREGERVSIPDKDKRRHRERLVDRASDAREGCASVGAGGEFDGEKEVGVNAGVFD